VAEGSKVNTSPTECPDNRGFGPRAKADAWGRMEPTSRAGSTGGGRRNSSAPARLTSSEMTERSCVPCNNTGWHPSCPRPQAVAGG
jgi:hypothetical protein